MPNFVLPNAECIDEHGNQFYWIENIRVDIDRRKGFRKVFRTPTGPQELAYPLDYGGMTFRINPEDREPADVFIGFEGDCYGRFHKGNTLEGDWRPDETKWYAGLTEAEREELLAWWNDQSPGLIRDEVRFNGIKEFVSDVVSRTYYDMPDIPDESDDELLSLDLKWLK